MAGYLTEWDYQGWLRQYYVNLSLYLDLLVELKVRLDALPDDPEAMALEVEVNETGQRIEEIVPRDFSVDEKPLEGIEKFLENLKVLYNLIHRARGKGDHYLGIYHEEKNKVLRLHQDLKFKDQYRQLSKKVALLEEKHHHEESQEHAIEALLVKTEEAAGQEKSA